MEPNVWYDVYESLRIYYFEGDQDLAIRSPVRLKVSEGGYHYLETSSGKKVIVSPGWMGIELQDGDWITEDDRCDDEDVLDERKPPRPPLVTHGGSVDENPEQEAG